MENQRIIQTANLDLVNLFWHRCGHTYDGIAVTVYMSYTLSAQKDMHVDDKTEKWYSGSSHEY